MTILGTTSTLAVSMAWAKQALDVPEALDHKRRLAVVDVH